MKYYSYLSILLVISIFFTACRCCTTPRTGLPLEEREYDWYSIHFTFQDSVSRESGKMICRFFADKTALFFLGPLNQVTARLYGEGEKVLLIPGRGKKFWQGEFRELLYSMWNLDISLQQIRAIFNGEDTFQNQQAGIFMEILETDDQGKPSLIRLTGFPSRLMLRVSRRETRRGGFPQRPILTHYHPALLEEIFPHD